MIKILLGIIAICILIFVIMICSEIFSERSAKKADAKNRKKSDKEFYKKQLCPKCKIGQASYELDIHSESCPYVDSFKDGKCEYYEPLKSSAKTEMQKRNFDN